MSIKVPQQSLQSIPPIPECSEQPNGAFAARNALDNFQMAQPTGRGMRFPFTIFDLFTACAEPTEDIIGTGDAGVPDSFNPGIYITTGYNYSEENRIQELQTPENCPSVFYVHVVYRASDNAPEAILDCDISSNENGSVVKINAPEIIGWPAPNVRRDVYQITWTPQASGQTTMRFSASVLENGSFIQIDNGIRLVGIQDQACPAPDEPQGPPPVVDIPTLENGMLSVREGETAAVEFTLNQAMGAGFSPALKLIGPDENGDMVDMDLPEGTQITDLGNGHFRFEWQTNYTHAGSQDGDSRLYYFQIALKDSQNNPIVPEGYSPQEIQVLVRNNSTPQFLPVDQENEEIFLPPIWEGDSIDWKLSFGDRDDDVDLGVPDDVQVLIDSGHIQRQSVQLLGDDAFPLMDDQTEQFIWRTQAGDGQDEPYRFTFTLNDGVNPTVTKTIVIPVLQGPPDHDGDGYPAGEITGAGFDCDDNDPSVYPPGPSAYELANGLDPNNLYQQSISHNVRFCPGTVRGVQILIDTAGMQADEGITIGAIGVHIDNSEHPGQPAVIITDRVHLTGLSVSGTTQAPAFSIVGDDQTLVNRVQLEDIRIEHAQTAFQAERAQDLSLDRISCFDTETCIDIRDTNGAQVTNLNVLQANNGVAATDSDSILLGNQAAFNTLDGIGQTAIAYTNSDGSITNTGVVGAQPKGDTGIEIINSNVDMSGVTATNFNTGFSLSLLANPAIISGLNAFGNGIGVLLNNVQRLRFDNGTIQNNNTGLEAQACGPNANSYTGMRIERNRINLNIPNGQCQQERLNITGGQGNRVGN